MFRLLSSVAEGTPLYACRPRSINSSNAKKEEMRLFRASEDGSSDGVFDSCIILQNIRRSVGVVKHRFMNTQNGESIRFPQWVSMLLSGLAIYRVKSIS